MVVSFLTHQTLPAGWAREIGYATIIFDSQNFIKDPGLVARLIDRCGIGPADVVVEIGPGRGAVTAQLARRCKRVVAIEKDPALSLVLRQRFAEQPNVTVRTGDFVEHPLPRKPYKMFSNIPFNLNSAIVTRLAEAANPPEDTCLCMQKEAAEMFLGRPRESLRSLLLKPWFEPQMVHRFRRNDFAPAPQVDVVLLRLRKRAPPPMSPADRQAFRDFVVYAFTSRHPALGGFLKEVFSLDIYQNLIYNYLIQQ